MAAAAELIDPLIRHQVFLQRLASGEVKKFLPFLRRMDRQLRVKLAGGELTEFSRKRAENLLRTVSELLAVLLGEFTAALLASLDDIALHEAGFTTRALAKFGVIDIESGVPAVPLIRAAVLGNPLSGRGPEGGKLLKPFIADWSRSERSAVVGLLRRGIFEGLTNAQMVRRIRGTKALNYSDGLLDITRRHAEAIVRTAVQHVSSQARQETYEQNDDIVRGIQWVSTLDSRTCATCRSLDAKVFLLAKGPRPPAHVNCRCAAVPVLKGSEDAFMRGMTRASRGDEPGQVSANLSYYEWLKKQSREFQDAALGKSRAKLFREGGLSADRFAALQLDRNFAPLTLEEMKRLEPLAFTKAGLE